MYPYRIQQDGQYARYATAYEDNHSSNQFRQSPDTVAFQQATHYTRIAVPSQANSHSFINRSATSIGTQRMAPTFPELSDNTSYSLHQLANTVDLERTTPFAETTRSIQADIPYFSLGTATSTGSTKIVPERPNIPNDSLDSAERFNTVHTSRLKTPAATQQDMAHPPKRQRQSKSSTNARHSIELDQPDHATKHSDTVQVMHTLSPKMSGHLGSQFTGSDRWMEHFSKERYSDIVVTDENATLWATTHLDSLSRNIYEDVYALLILCQVHFQDPIHNQFEVKINVGRGTYATTRSASRALEKVFQAFQFSHAMFSEKNKRRAKPMDLQDLKCLRHWLDIFLNQSKSVTSRLVGDNFDCAGLLVLSWGDYELNSPLDWFDSNFSFGLA